MSVVVVTPPVIPESLFVAAKDHLRAADFTDDDFTIARKLAAAVASLDGPGREGEPGGWLRRAVLTQTLEYRADAFFDCNSQTPWDITLPMGRVASVSSVAYDDSDGVPQVVDPANYRTVGNRIIRSSAGYSWPSVRVGPSAVRVTYVAGYDEMPADLEAAVLLITADLYENREGQYVALGALAIEQNPTLKALTWSYRLWD